MKRLLKYGFIAFVICSCCDVCDKYDKLEVVDVKTGRVYILKHNRNDDYFIKPKTIEVIDTMYCR
tara:strand:+ start:204 stop:398 length:195 start_codon:yes stop_codon:yes gene_type:complete